MGCVYLDSDPGPLLHVFPPPASLASLSNVQMHSVIPVMLYVFAEMQTQTHTPLVAFRLHAEQAGILADIKQQSFVSITEITYQSHRKSCTSTHTHAGWKHVSWHTCSIFWFIWEKLHLTPCILPYYRFMLHDAVVPELQWAFLTLQDEKPPFS